jgi:hypothetical protein
VLDHAAALQRLVHAFLEEAHALAAVAFGARQGNSRVTQQRGGVVAVGRRERGTGADGDRQLLARDHERPSQLFDQSIHEIHDFGKIGDIDESDGELVAARPRYDVALAQHRLNTGGNVAQHLIAATMVDGVVDFLEIVDLEAKDGDAGAIAMNARHGLGQAVAEGLAIGEAGQRIVLLEIAELRLGLAALAPPHPAKRGEHGDARSEKQQRDGRGPAEIAGENLRLVALIEIDNERAPRIAVERKRESEGGKIRRRRGVRTLVQRDLGLFRRRAG